MLTLEGKSLAQAAAVLLGLAYAVGGIIGFAVTGFSGVFDPVGHKFIGLTINPFHDFVHLGIGLGLLWAATRDTSVTEGVLLGVGGVYVVATITGFIYAHIPVLSITTSGNADNYLHLVTGATAILVAVISGAATTHQRRQQTA
jgi:hypothetical protein